MNLNVIKLGLIEYGKALIIQERLLAMRQQDLIGDCVLLVEHNPVFTIGKNGKYSNILASKELIETSSVSIIRVGRGGDVTYHGPGQIVGYPIMDLNAHRWGIKDFVWKIEEIFICLLAQEFNIIAHREEKEYTGVWVGDKKITAIGLAVKRWVTMHGFAFNVNTGLEYFRWINPCGIMDRGVTSLQKILGKQLNFDEMNRLVVRYFCQVFQVKPEIREITDILKDENIGTENTSTKTGLA